MTPPKGAPSVLLIMTDDVGFSAPSTFGGLIPTPALDRVAKMGLRFTRPSHFGGTRNGMAMCWPARIKDAGSIRNQFHHVIDIVPTILEAAGLPEPAMVNGIAQKPIEGTSMVYTWDKANAPDRRTTQYFEMFGSRAIYREGWVAAAPPVITP